VQKRPLALAIALACLAAAPGVAAEAGGIRQDDAGSTDSGSSGGDPPAPAADTSTGFADPALAGLVALDASLGEDVLYLDANDVESGGGQCPGPSGCVADLAVGTIHLPEFGDGLQLRTQAAVVVVANRPHSTIAGEDIRVRATASEGFELDGPRCDPVPELPRTVECPLGSLAVGEETSVLLQVRDVDPDQRIGWVTVSVSASTPDPIPENDSRWAGVGADSSPTVVRLAGTDASTCPDMSLHLSATTPAGQYHPAPQPGFDGFTLLDNGLTPASGPDLLPSDQVQVSAVYIVDDSAALASSFLDLQLALVAESAMAWYQRAAASGWPAPALAVTSLSAGLPPVLVSDFDSFEAQLDLIEQTTAPGDAIARATGMAQALSGRPGRKGVILMMSGTSVPANDALDPVAALIGPSVPVHPVVLEPSLEPLADRIASVTRGFRQVAAQGSTGAALDNAVRSIEDATTIAWQSQGDGAPARRLLVSAFGPSFNALINTFYSQAGSPCAQACAVEREIDAPSYSAASPALVRLRVAASPDPAPFTLEERVPDGWSVLAVGQGGVYDSSLRRIRWNGTSGPAAVEFAYALTGPPSAGWSMSPGTMTGELMPSSGPASPVCGDTRITQIPIHPADLLHNGSILSRVLPAYTDAWLHGLPWPSGWGLVSAAQLTRAAQISALGNTYIRVAAELPWQSVLHPPGPYIASAVRTAPAAYVPGEPVRVELQVQPMPGSHAGAIEEVPPAGWQVTDVGRSGRYDPVTRTIRWGLYRADQPVQVSYTLLPPPDAQGLAGFSGRYFVDGEWMAFAGSVSLLPGGDPLFADGFEPR